MTGFIGWVRRVVLEVILHAGFIGCLKFGEKKNKKKHKKELHICIPVYIHVYVCVCQLMCAPINPHMCLT